MMIYKHEELTSSFSDRFQLFRICIINCFNCLYINVQLFTFRILIAILIFINESKLSTKLIWIVFFLGQSKRQRIAQRTINVTITTSIFSKPNIATIEPT